MKLLVTGASGSLGGHIFRLAQSSESFDVIGLRSPRSRNHGEGLVEVDLTNSEHVRSFCQSHHFDGVIHAAALSSVEDCRSNPELSQLVNVVATKQLITVLNERNPSVRSLYVSTDMVFDGREPPYSENDQPNPLSRYGQTKLSGEKAFRDSGGGVIVRLPLMFGFSFGGRKTFFDKQVDLLKSGETLGLFDDEWRTPLSYRYAASALLDVIKSGFNGLLHVAGDTRVSRYKFGQMLASALQVDPSGIKPVSSLAMEFREPRPQDLTFDIALWRKTFPSWNEVSLEKSLGEEFLCQ